VFFGNLTKHKKNLLEKKMNLTIETLSHKPLEFYSELPVKFPGPRLPGGEVLSANGEFGDLCIQEFNGGNFIIRYSVLETKEPFILDSKSHHSGMHAAIMLRNSIHPVFKTAEEIKISEGQFTILQAHQPAVTVNFEGKQQYICFEAMLSHVLAVSLLADFPELPVTLSETAPQQPDIWVNPAKWTDHEVREHIHYILTYSDPVKWRRNYFENRVWDITWKLLAIHMNKTSEESILTEDEKEKAHQVHQLIIDHLDKHLLIRELAKKVGASESRLKRIFMKAYGMGMHEYRIYERLKMAIQLINEGMTVKQAAAYTGWRPADLIKAYHKVYGTTPGTIRKKR
jgi:AraC-like DNA-binding protein